jgi:hypothetical protein
MHTAANVSSRWHPVLGGSKNFHPFRQDVDVKVYYTQVDNDSITLLVENESIFVLLLWNSVDENPERKNGAVSNYYYFV